MEEQLKEILWKYIIENNPELMFSLQENYTVGSYLDGKLRSIRSNLETWSKNKYSKKGIEILSMELLTKDLKPSRFHYLKQILKKDFYTHYLIFQENGTLTYELIKLINLCTAAFEAIGFSQVNQNSPRLYKATKSIISNYLSHQ